MASRVLELVDMAVEPAFAQIRNAAMPLQAELTTAQDLLKTLDVLLEQFSALQMLLQHGVQPLVREIVRASSSLASHHTALVGGVRWMMHEPERTIVARAQTSVALLSASLSLIAQGLHANKEQSGIVASVRSAPTAVTFEFRSALEGTTLEEYRLRLDKLVPDDDVGVSCSEDSLVVSLAAS
jgi:hypothetical protein